MEDDKDVFPRWKVKAGALFGVGAGGLGAFGVLYRRALANRAVVLEMSSGMAPQPAIKGIPY